MQVAHQVFQGLAKYVLNEQGEMVAEPDIAEKWETTDSQTWTFTLKQGVMFQAPVSREVVAQDFVDSWNRVTDPANQSYVSYILAPVEGCDDGGYQVDPKKGLTGVKAVDDYTLEVKLRYPFAEFPQTLGHTVAAATPVEYIDKVGAKAYGKKPVGTGPYIVESWKNNQSVQLVKNPDYWDTENAGWVDRINMPIILESSTEWLEFQKGTTDYTNVPPGQVAAAENNAKVKSGEWTAKRWPTLAVYFIGMNMTDATLGQDLELRKAIAMSTDSQNVINIVNEGVPLAAQGYVPVGIPGYQPEQSPYGFDPEGAKTVVDGLGTIPTLNYWYNTDEGHQKIAEVLQAGWKNAGHRREAQQLRVGHVPRQALEGRPREAAASSSAWAGSPTTRRWTTSCIRCSSRTRHAPAATRSTPTAMSTTCCCRRARRWMISSATTCTCRRRSRSSRTCRRRLCTSTVTSA